MAEEQSFLFDFTRTPTFFENFNIKFNLSDMNTSKDVAKPLENFELVLASYCETNIQDCLNNDGTLADTVEIGVNADDEELVKTVGLDWIRDSYGDGTIELHGDVVFDVGDIDVQLKAIFLRDKTTKFVMGYSINMVAVPVTNQVVFDDEVIFWDITRFNNYG